MMEQHAFPVIDLRATGANILRLRKERGLTVRDLQAYFGFEAPQAIYRWQSGVSLPTVDNLYALSILLNVTMEDILIVRNRSVCEQQAELDCSVFLFMAIHRFSWKNSCLNRREAAIETAFPENACFQKQNRIKADSPCTLFPFIPGYSVYHSPAAKALNCKFNTLPGHAQTPAHSASCRGSGVMRLFGDSPRLCAFFLQRMRFGKCDNLFDRRGVRAVFEISHIDAAMHRILFKRFEEGIRRVHLAMIRPDQQHGVLVGGTMARLMEGWETNSCSAA